MSPLSRLSPVLLVAALAASGCASVGSMQSARTLGAGSTQVALEMGEQALVSRDQLRAYPVAGIAVRHGVSARVDLGARVGPSAIEALAKVQLTRPDPEARGVAVSLAPALGAYAWDPGGVEIRSYNLALPVLLGFPFGPERQHEIVLGPRLHGHAFSLSAGSARGYVDVLSAGATAGIVWKMPAARGVRIATELGALRPVVTVVDRSDGVGGVSFQAERWTLQANLAFLIGGGR